MKFFTSIFFIVFLGISAFSQPYDRYYNNNAGTNDWSNSGNWQNGDIADDNEDWVHLDADDVTVDAPFTIKGIRIDPATPGTHKTISGSDVLTIDTDNSGIVFAIHNTSSTGISMEITADMIIDNPQGGSTNFRMQNSAGNNLTFDNIMTINTDVQSRAFGGATITYKGEIHGSAQLTFGHNSNLNEFTSTADNSSFSGTFQMFLGNVVSDIVSPAKFLPSGTLLRIVDDFPGGFFTINGDNTLDSDIETHPNNDNFTITFNADQTTMGTLNHQGGNLIFDHPSNRFLSFENSSAFPWTGDLIINNFAENQIRFGTDNTGLTVAQLAKIDVGGPQVDIDNNGYLVYGCSMTGSGLSNIQCNDNGTPSDPSDDFFTFELDPQGSGLGSNGYVITGASVTPSGGSYGSSTTFSTNPGTAGAGDLSITIEDADKSSCTFSETVTDPGTCSNACNMTASGLTNIQCDDNGTPSDPSDDFFTFELDPQGQNLGTGYTITGASVTPSGGNYGSSTTFSTSSGTAGAGDLSITIEDNDDPNCNVSETVTDPGTCSNQCNLMSSGLTNIQCNDNGTPSDPSDDFFTFELDPQGQNLGTGFTITGASVTPSGGNYGSSTTFSTASGTAGAGDLSLTIEDNDDSSCTLSETVTDPGTCSNQCNMTASGLTNIQCDDNGTPSDPSDDFFTFELDPQGQNLGTGYTITGASVTPSGGNYGSSTTFSTASGTAGAGDLSITIEDNDDSSCTISETVTDPGTCSNACNLTTSGLTNIQCDDNGTPSDPSDDFFTFELDPQGQNLGTGYTISGASVTPSGGNYGSSTLFSTSSGTAGAGDLSITIEDNDDSSCTLSETVTDPGTCSNQCNMTASGLTNIQCDDNGTPSDPSDDFFTFELDPQGSNLGSGYMITGASVTPSGGNYGSSTTFSTSSGTAGAGDLSITIEDNDDSSCTLSETVTDPGTCSNQCNMTASGLTNIQCDDNGTPSDPSDDFFTFELDPQGQNLGTGYTITGASVTPSGGNYGSSTTFSTSNGTAGAGDLSITIEDDDDSSCTFSETVTDPGSCSNTCEITDSGISGIICDDNGTPADPSDDFIIFELDPTGNNQSSGYTLTGISVTPSGGNYGSLTIFSTDPGTAGGGDLNFTIEDDNDPNCTFSETIFDPGSCSDACNIFDSGISNIQCDDNGTPTDYTDDFITFQLDPIGDNLGFDYNIVGISVTPSFGTYGAPTIFSTDPGTAGTGDLNFTIEDGDDPSCTIAEIVIDPGNCSNDCEILNSGIFNEQCDDNGTPSDPSDDFITFELDPTGTNLGSGYTLSGISVTPSGGNYGSITTFSTDPGTAGGGDLNFSIDDNSNGGCFLSETLLDPGSCSDECNISDSGISNIQCNDNGTPADDTDDFITFELDPSGNNLGFDYNIVGISVTPNSGTYGTITIFSTASGTAGGGNLNFTIEDGGDPSCTYAEIITDPGSCSNACEILASGLTNIQCNDNSTPSDPSDDFITFEINPSGNNLGSGYILSGISVTPSGGNYSSLTSFSTAPGTAGGGNLNFSIEDNSNTGCSLSETVTDPGTCSAACQISGSGLTNVQCNDNGTPSDPTDDFISFELNPQGSNLSANYTIVGISVTPSGGNYGAAATFTTAPGTAGAGDLNFTIIDADDGGCTFAETLTDPGACSSTCELLISGLINVTCNDNGTPADATDDFITFELDPQGNNLGAGYTVRGAAVTPNSGSYGVRTMFSTAPGTAGLGNLSLAITDDANANCSLSESVFDPGTCSGTCNLTASGLTNIRCDDNGTPTDPTDDFITFEINPSGNNLGSGYILSGISVSPSGGNYGATTMFSTAPGTAGSGDLNFSIEDDATPGCDFGVTLTDPGNCSATCELTATGLTNIQCDDNGTPSDPSDDFISFELNPMGSNLGNSYQISGLITTPSIGNYGNSTVFSTQPGSAGAGNLNITITDDADANCSLSENITDPGSCSGSCNLQISGLSNIICNDNGTPSDATDDFITFDLNPSGSNLGVSYTVSGAAVTPVGGNYGLATSFSTSPGTAGLGDLNLMITDDADANCSLSETLVDPGTCSGTCNLTASGLTNIQCVDNGTPTDPADDFLTFELNPTGGNLGTNYTLTGAVLSPSGGNYGSSFIFSTEPGIAGAGDLNLTIVDGTFSNCTFGFAISDPGACSNNCNLGISGLSNITCNDNDTPSDATDDFITFELNPQGSNLGASYTVSGAAVTPSGGNYGLATSFSTAPGTAGLGDLNLIIADDAAANCSLSENVVDPGTCSAICILATSGLTNVTCNDNGTPSDDTDDFITFDLNPQGSNLGASYTVSGAAVTPSGGNYGLTTSFSTAPGTAGLGDLNLIIADDAAANCSLLENVVDPGTCSGTCNLTASGLRNIQCNDNATPGDETDDFITFELNPSGNILGIGYSVSGTSVMPSMANYGVFTTFSTPPGTAGAGDLNLTITDDTDADCRFGFALSDPGNCKDCDTFSVDISVPPGICEGESIDLSFTFSGGMPPFTIRYSDGQSANDIMVGAGGVFTQSVILTETTTFTILEITDADNCSGTPGANVTVEVFSEATGAFADSFCEGENYTLPDGSVVSDPDVYEIILQNQSTAGCDSTITISLTQNRSFSFSESVTVCDASDYEWGGQTYNSSGIYSQNLQTAAGCDSTLTLDLTFDGLAAFGEAEAGDDVDECLSEAELFGLEIPGTAGMWSSPTGAAISPANQGAALASGLSTGQNLFVWTLSTADCPDFDSDTAVVNVMGAALVLSSDNASFEQEEPIQIQILNNDDLTGISQFSVTCFGLSPEITDCDFDENNAVLNLQTDSDAVGDFELFYSICSDACPDLCDTTIVFLNIFEKRDDSDQTNYIITPNGDGLNETLIFDDLDDYPENELVIYNRWGVAVYRASPYDNSWDGTRNGKRLPEADYYYVMRKELPGKIEYGNVTIKY